MAEQELATSRLAIHGLAEVRRYGQPPGADPGRDASRPPEGQVRFVSDRPFDQPYNERPECLGHRTNGHKCKAKAQPGLEYCADHDVTKG